MSSLTKYLCYGGATVGVIATASWLLLKRHTCTVKSTTESPNKFSTFSVPPVVLLQERGEIAGTWNKVVVIAWYKAKVDNGQFRAAYFEGGRDYVSNDVLSEEQAAKMISEHKSKGYVEIDVKTHAASYGVQDWI